MTIRSYGFSRPIPEAELPPLVFYETKKQQTRLVVDSDGCRIELTDKATGEVKKYSVSGRRVEVNPDYKESTGLVNIGNREKWLYSKHLFLDEAELERQIQMRLEAYGGCK
jgi:glycine cleavage system H lipoate-binding protein